MQTKNNEAEFDKPQSGTGTWSSLDIFLFGNGQKYSPPRKYNLRASELDWWDATLNYLARSQYGSKHTNIELYTIDGKKIGGPMELSNGAAYVAVAPPDAFVQSGYEQYLIKATRSWEKRQEKKSSNSTLTKPVPDKVNVNHEIIRPADNNDSTSIQIIQDIRIQPGTTMVPNAQDQTVITVKSDSVSKVKPNVAASTTKQVSRRKSSGYQQRPSILRKNYANPVPPPPPAQRGSRDSRATKVDLTKKKLESSSKRSQDVVPLKNGTLLTTKITESKLESTNKIDNNITVTQSTGENNFSDKKEPPASTTALAISVLNCALENKSADIDIQKDEIIEKDILSVSFHSEENFQSICINANNRVKENLIPLNDTTPRILNSTPAAASHHSNFGPNQFALPSRLPSGTDGTVTQKNYVMSDSQTAENIVISISPGDTVKLKLSIAFENSSSSTDTPKNELETEIRQPSSAPLAAKSELECPGRHALGVHHAPRPCGVDTPTILTTSWQTTFTDENIEEELNDVKLQFCHCNCCLNSGKVLPARATPVYVDNNNYFILLPSLNKNEKIISCSCGQENSKNNSSDERQLVLPNTASDAVESASVKENTLLISRTRSKTSECQCPTSESSRTKNQTSTLEDAQLSKFIASKCCVCDDTSRNASDAIFRVASTNNSTTVTDNSTQTNWNNILLEARLHHDGHYTFHMPPLDKIKI